MKKIRCIVVDDESHIRTFMATVLQRVGLEVVGEASNGEEGLALFEKTRPDLVVMDVNMPLKNGDEVVEKIKAMAPETRVVILTSLADMGTISRCLEAGADDYIRKDTPYGELKTLIEELVSGMEERS